MPLFFRVVSDDCARACVQIVSHIARSVLHIVAAVLIFKPWYQRRWQLISTCLMIISALVGTAPLSFISLPFYMQTSIGPMITNQTNAGPSFLSIAVVYTLQIPISQRGLCLIALRLLSYVVVNIMVQGP